ncbi:MAG: hypothetical protein D3918_05230 [Candidatus Electrothrix sp. AX2]|nr:hypothetical protein [Candidatus Electrothrix gigas]
MADKKVRVETVHTDQYGRTVALVRVGRKMLNRELVRAGYACKGKAKGDHAVNGDLLAVEQFFLNNLLLEGQRSFGIFHAVVWIFFVHRDCQLIGSG